MLSLVLDLLTHVNVNYFQLFMISTNHMTVIFLWKLRKSFLHISKAFDRVWHNGLIYKIKSFGMSDIPLKLIDKIS